MAHFFFLSVVEESFSALLNLFQPYYLDLNESMYLHFKVQLFIFKIVT